MSIIIITLTYLRAKPYKEESIDFVRDFSSLYSLLRMKLHAVSLLKSNGNGATFDAVVRPS